MGYDLGNEPAVMSEPRLFKAFFSYAHHDAETDPGLLSAFTTALENRVNARLVGARFAIWRDKEGIRTGDRWNSKIESELRGSDVLIVLLTPRWIDSEFCRKEYAIFEQIEAEREFGEYVAPILIRTIEKQVKHFSNPQKKTYEQIRSRQCHEIVAAEFLQKTYAKRIALIDKVADDLEGMIERLRALTISSAPSKPRPLRSQTPREFDSRAQNYERVDFVTDGEVVLTRPGTDGYRDVLAHVGFVERLYVQGEHGRIEFGVRRAFILLCNRGHGRLSKIDGLKGHSDRKNVYYIALHDTPLTIAVCMDPLIGQSSLSELPLPPADGENFLSKLAKASADVESNDLTAELVVILNVEGLYLAGTTPPLSKRTAEAIKAIMNVAKAKITRGINQTVDQTGEFRRTLVIRERS
jgi:hypothetical protein